MTDRLNAFFDGEKIEYRGVLAYSNCHEYRADIMARESFTPRSVIIFLLPYYGGETDNLSLYAAARDYHIIIKEVTGRLCALLSEEYPGSHSKGYGDHSPLDERGAALSAGLGILGENGLIINEKYGSYVFIADVITDIPPEILGAASKKEIRRCPGCGACRRACPTGILRGEGETCLSAITQKKGELTDDEVALMKKYNTVWGCDICQTACPYNRRPAITPIEFFLCDRVERLDTETLATMDKEEFSSRAFAWRGRRTVERNLEYLDI